jgi:hypothetical protein
MKIVQLNMHHSIAATSELAPRLCGGLIDVCLLQEPYIRNNEVVGLNDKNYDLVYKSSGEKQRTCLVVKKGIKFILLNEYSSGDETTAKVVFREKNGGESKIVLCSAYFPYDSPNPPSLKVESLVSYARINGKRQ